MPAWLVSLIGIIVPKLIVLFFSDLQERQAKLKKFEEWQKMAADKGSQIADSVEQTKVIEEELKKRRDNNV